jgi:hypothetical protein
MKWLALLLKTAFVVSFFCFAAQAQTKRDPIQQFNDNVKSDIAGKVIENVQSKFDPATNNALKELADFISGDISGAADLAISIPDTLDGNGQVCFDAMASAGKIFQENPIPSQVDTKQGVVSALERIRLLAMTANRICQLPACTQIFADATGALAQLAPIKMPIPDLHQICSLIPTVAVGKPTRTLPMPTPSPTPAQ